MKKKPFRKIFRQKKVQNQASAGHGQNPKKCCKKMRESLKVARRVQRSNWARERYEQMRMQEEKRQDGNLFIDATLL